MTNEDKIIQDNIKLCLLYENLEKMIYLPSIKLHEIEENHILPSEEESSLYYILRITTEILKSYMQDNNIPIHKDNNCKHLSTYSDNKLLAHNDFSSGLANLIRLYQILDDERLGKMDSDMIYPTTEHPLDEYRCLTSYNSSIYFDAYISLYCNQQVFTEKEFFNQHPLLNPNEHFTFI